MTDITFNCSGCGQELEAPEEMAGDIVECPNCQQQITVPQPSQPEEESQKLSAGSAVSAAMAAADSNKAQPSSRKCPECGADMVDEAVLCVKCGFNIKLGRKMTTDLS